MSLPPPPDYDRIVHAVRLDLEAAGNPAFLVAIVEGVETVHTSPVIFASARPASDHAKRLASELAGGSHAVIICRHAAGHRQTFAVLDPKTLKKLHSREEVIERSLAAVRSETV